MNLPRILCALFILATFEVAAYSGDRVVICDSCSTYGSFQDAALGAVPNGFERLYVVNRDSRVIHRYHVIKESEPGHSITEASEIEPTSQDLQQINSALDAYHFVKSLGHVSFDEIQPYLPTSYRNNDSALDFAPHDTRRFSLVDAYNAWASDGISGVVSQFIVGAVSVIFDFINSSAIIHFPDGSTIRVDFRDLNFSQDGEPLADYAFIEARDSAGNRIPTSGDLSGLSLIGTSGLTNEWGDLADRLGWDLQRVGNTCDRVRLKIVCTSGPPRQCTIQPEPVCP